MKMWAKGTWQLRYGLQVFVFGGSLILFEFEDRMEVERVLARGSRRFKERLLSLERWRHEIGCEVKEGSCKEAWVRVLGLPLNLWSHEVFIKVGDCCGGFVTMDEGSVNSFQLQWASEVEWEKSTHFIAASGRVFELFDPVVVGSSPEIFHGCSEKLQQWVSKVEGQG